MRLSIRHVTEYSLEERAQFVLQETRMRPQSNASQQVLDWRVDLEGGALEAAFDDHHGNRVMLFSLFGAERVRLVCEGDVETTDRAGIFGPHGHANHAPMTKDFDDALHTNVLGAMQLIPTVAPMVEAAKGKFVAARLRTAIVGCGARSASSMSRSTPCSTACSASTAPSSP